MRRIQLALFCIAAIASSSTAAADTEPFAAWKPLLGEWEATGGGAPGAASGGFTFALDLGGKILVRKNRAEYPATKDHPATTHEDLMIVYAEGGALKAVYFDNEGHAIRYSVTTADKSIVLLSDPAPGPRFRLTYDWSKPALAILFEIAPPATPDKFAPYVTGSARRAK